MIPERWILEDFIENIAMKASLLHEMSRTLSSCVNVRISGLYSVFRLTAGIMQVRSKICHGIQFYTSRPVNYEIPRTDVLPSSFNLESCGREARRNSMTTAIEWWYRFDRLRYSIFRLTFASQLLLGSLEVEELCPSVLW